MVMCRCSLAGWTEGNRHSTNQCVVPIKVLKLFPESGCVDGPSVTLMFIKRSGWVDGAVSHADVHQEIGVCRCGRQSC